MAGGTKIVTGLRDAIAFSRGDASRGHLSKVSVSRHIDVRAICQRLLMSQQEFALRFGFSVATLRNWEQGHRNPEGPARVLLTLIQRIPDQVTEALRAA